MHTSPLLPIDPCCTVSIQIDRYVQTQDLLSRRTSDHLSVRTLDPPTHQPTDENLTLYYFPQQSSGCRPQDSCVGTKRATRESRLGMNSMVIGIRSLRQPVTTLETFEFDLELRVILHVGPWFRVAGWWDCVIESLSCVCSY